MNPRHLLLLAVAISFSPGCQAKNGIYEHPADSGSVSAFATPPADGGYEKININIASMEELQRLPHIGPSMARKIIEHREQQGPFKRPEELMSIDGVSDARFRRIRSFIRVE